MSRRPGPGLLLWGVLAVPLGACWRSGAGETGDSTDTAASGDSEVDDADGDGVAASEDCDDEDASVYPGAEEQCGDGRVNDCDGTESEALRSCLPEGEYLLSQADAVLEGSTLDDWAGYPVNGAGDLDGDGYDDVVISVRLDDEVAENAGRVFVHHGPVSPGRTLAEADAIFEGRYAWEFFGSSVASGDVDGDGLPDLLVGGAWDTTGNSEGLGGAYLFLSPQEGRVPATEADAVLEGFEEDSHAGWSVGVVGSGLADRDAQGVGDLAVGFYALASEGKTGAGAVALLPADTRGTGSLEGAERWIRGVQEDENLGSALDGARDVTGDGVYDLVVGAPGNGGASFEAGAVYLFEGPVTAGVDADEAGRVFFGEHEGDRVGRSLCLVPDADGDGTDDLLLGASFGDGEGEDAGLAYLVTDFKLGTRSLAGAAACMVGPHAGGRAGYAVAGAGDLDRDGLEDLLVGAIYGGAGGDGEAYQLLSPVSGTVDLAEARVVFTAEGDKDRVGCSLDGAGDVDGDGFADLIIGANEAADGPGKAYLVLGNGY